MKHAVRHKAQMAGLMLIGCLALLGMTLGASSAKAQAQLKAQAQASAGSEAPLHIEGAETVDTAAAKVLYETGALFVDVRPRSIWNFGHITDSRHFALRTTFSLLRHEGFIERDAPLVLYGNGPHTYRSAIAVRMALLWGYTRVYFYRDGYFSWLAEDYPVAFKGEDPVVSRGTIVPIDKSE